GQFSARTQGTGGSLAEFDPLSPVNPSSIGVFQTRILFFQLEPEFRSVRTSAGSEHTSTARYPIVLGALPLGKHFVIGLSSSTLLDRTSTTSFETEQILTATDTVPMTTTYQISGAMNDNRLALAWAPYQWLRVGAGAHAITGHNLINITQAFPDTIVFSAFKQQTIIGFSGGAASVGLQLVSKYAALSGSARWGGSLRASVGDTVLGRANVPDQYGVSLSFLAIPNSAISVRTAHENWSVMRGLGTPGLVGVDSWDSSVGADIAGPRITNRTIFIRAGARTRDLPFQAAGATVHEKSFSGGLGTTFANGRVMADVAAIRSLRDADIDASERAWTLSFGISVRP
ncbi:MAG TPA: hypothetical protein VH559_02850, partial [Gemmatimonadaceae bacterium]